MQKWERSNQMHVSKQVWGECCLLRGAHSKWMSTGTEQLELKQPVLQSEVCTHGELLHALRLSGELLNGRE